MKSTSAVNVAFLVSALLLLAAAPFADGADDVDLFCNKKTFSGDEAGAAIATLDKLLDRLVANTFSDGRRRLCTKQSGDTTLFGLATCAAKSTAKQCSTCLATARFVLLNNCDKPIGAKTNVKTKTDKSCFMRFEKIKFC